MPLRTHSTSRLVQRFALLSRGMLCAETAQGREGLLLLGTLGVSWAQD